MAQQAWVQQWNRARRPPRRSRTAFSMFIRTNYHNVRGRLGTRKPQIVYRACAQVWRNMPPQDRRRYTQMEDDDRRRYYQERDAWARKFPGRVPRIRRRRKPRDAPKRPRNPFILYRMDNWKETRSQNPDMSQQDITRVLAKRWKEVPETTKMSYKERTTHERERYASEMSQFRYQQAEVDAQRRFQNFEARIEALRVRDAYRRRRQEIEKQLMDQRAKKPTFVI